MGSCVSGTGSVLVIWATSSNQCSAAAPLAIVVSAAPLLTWRDWVKGNPDQQASMSLIPEPRMSRLLNSPRASFIFYSEKAPPEVGVPLLATGTFWPAPSPT
jgi:hypothetical protein